MPRAFVPQSWFIVRLTFIAAAGLATPIANPALAQMPEALPGSGWVVIDDASPWSDPPEPQILASVLDSVSLTVTIPGFQVETAYHGDDEFQKLSFLGESFTSETGKPELPVVRMMLAIPGCDSYSLSAELGDSTDFSDASIWPVPSWAVGYQDEYEYVYEVYAIDEDLYEEDVLYPEGAAVIADDGWVRDQRYVILEVHPVRYNPALSLLRCYSSVTVDIRFEDPEQTNVRGVGPFEPACRSVMVNYDGVGAWTPRDGRGDPCIADVGWFSTVSGCAGHNTDYLVIVEDSIIDEETIEALAEKKSWYDCLNVAIVKVSDIADPSISPQAIKDFIRGVYEAGTAEHVLDGHLGYVLLIGDAREAEDPSQGQSQELLPAYEDSLPLSGVPGTDAWVPTDHWYACVHGGDYVADLAIGRLPVGDTTELQTEVNKIVGYEPIRLSSEWANDIFLSCSFADGDPGGHETSVDYEEIPAIEGILLGESIDVDELHVHAYQCTSSWQQPPLCQHEEYGRPGNVAAVNDSVLIMLLWGHGFPCGSLSFKSQDVPSLHNAPALPFWINISCSTGNFAYTAPNHVYCQPDSSTDCLGEYLMHWSDDGAVAFFGATKATGNLNFGRLILGALYDQSYGMIGQAVAEAKMELWVEEQGTLRELHAYNLLGDPALNLFLGEETGYGGACDLVVREKDVVVIPELANYGDEMTFECLVSNEGPEGTGSEVPVAFDLYDSSGQLVERVTDTIGALGAWSSATASATWTSPIGGAGAYDLIVYADPDTVIDELFESNNQTDPPTHFYVYFYAEGFPITLPSTPQSDVLVSPVAVCRLRENEGQDIISSYRNGHVAAMDQFGDVVWSYSPQEGCAPGAFSPTVADFDLDGTPEVVIVVPGRELPGLPRQDNVLVLKPTKAGGPQVWKQVEVGEVYSAPLLMDIDPLDGRPEVAIVGLDGQEEGRLSVWDFSPETPVQRWQKLLGSGSPWRRTGPPTAVNFGLHPADLVTWDYAVDDTLMLCASGDGELSWKLGIPGWEGQRGFGIAAGDLDGGGKILLVSAAASPGELIVSSSTDPVEVVWTAAVQGTCEVAIGNVDSDEDLEIVCAGGRSVLVFKNDSSGVPAWTAHLEGTAVGEPLIGDFDGEDDVEIIVGALLSDDQTLLYILSVPAGQGTLELAVDPVEIAGAYATGALCDLDDDGRNDIVFATDDGLLHRLEYWSTSDPRFEWPMYRHEDRNSGLYEQPVAGSLAQSATWSGGMFMEGDVEVPEGATLYLAPGTDVEVAHDWDSTVSGRDSMLSELIVEGTLHCVGGSLWPIEFRSDESPSLELPDWYGITLEEGAVCALAHVEATDAYKSLWAMAPEALDVRDCSFLNQSMMGLHLEGCGDATAVADCAIGAGDIGIRADSCATYLGGNTITGAREYGIRLYDDRGSTVEGNEITVGPGTAPLLAPRGIYCFNAFNPVDISILDNDVTVSVADNRCEGICVYAVPLASVNVTGNEAAWTGTGENHTKGIRLGKTAAVAHWNRLTGFYYHFYVEPDDNQIPDLGDTVTYGNNATDDEAGYNIYAVAQAPMDSLPAQMNWWGAAYPSGRKFWGVGIDIVWEPYLEEDPGGRGGQQETGDVALRYRLEQNCPNPFNPLTILSYTIPKESRVRIAVYDLTGRLVRVLCDGMRGAGEHEVSWDGRNEIRQDAGSGVYFCRMEAGSFSESRKLVLLK